MNKPELVSFREHLMLSPFFDQRQFFAPEIENMKNGLDALFQSGLITEEKSSLIEYHDKVAVLTIEGAMRPGRDWYFSVGYGDIQAAIIELIDSDVETVIQYFNTPGGTANQSFETEEMFYELAKEKRLVSAIEMATSAGALLTFPAQERYLLGKTAQTGSIGVIATHIDNRSWYRDFMGEIRTTVAKGEFKDAGTDTREYDAKAKLIFEETVSKLYSIFVESAARGLGKSATEIEAQESRVYIGQDGIDQGFAQGYSTLKQLIEKYNAGTTFFTPGRPALSNIQTEENFMDIKKLEADHPDVYKAVYDRGKDEGLKASNETAKSEGEALGMQKERVRMAGIDELAFPSEFAAKAKNEGWQPAEAALAYQKLDAENRKKIADGMEGDLQSPLENNAPEPAKEPEAEEKKNPVELFNEAVKAKEDSGMKKPEAIKAVAKAQPELHREYVNALKNGGKDG